MNRFIPLASLALLLVAVAGTASAQFSGQGISGSLSGAGRSAMFYIEADFGATAHTETWTWTLTTDHETGFDLVLFEVPTMSTATNAAAWNASILSGSTGSVPGGTSVPLGYNTPNLSGVHRFCFYVVSPANGYAGTVAAQNISVSVNNGTNVATAFTGGGNAEDQYNSYANVGASGTSSADSLYQPNMMRTWTSLGAAADKVAYVAEIDHGGTGQALNMSLYTTYNGSGTGGGTTSIKLYDMTLNGGQSSVLDVDATGTVAAPSEDCKTYQTPNRTGVHRYRVVLTGGTGFTPSPETYAHLTWGGNPAYAAPVTPFDAGSPVSISPAGTSLTTSPTALSATGGSGTPSYTWSLQGTVPTGVSLSATTGTPVNLIFGSTTPAGSTVTVRCTNGTTGEFDEETYTLNFGGGGGGNSLTIITTTLPNGSETVTYTTTTITATSTGTTGPTYTWSVSAGTIPPGLVLDTAATGLSTTISGTPTTAGTYNFTVQITDGTNSDTQAYQVDISAAGSLVITTASLPAGTQGVAYSANITAINGTGNHTWSITSGTLPTGLALGASTTGTVSISGTPTQTGTFPITVQVTDSTSPTAQTDTQAFSLVINAGSPPPTLGGGGGGGGGGGCAAAEGSSYWMLALGLLAVLGLGLRMRARRE